MDLNYGLVSHESENKGIIQKEVNRKGHTSL